jgi:translocation and assembly module TamB
MPGRNIRRLLAAGTTTMALLAGGTGWLLGSESGLQAAVKLASRLSDGQLEIAQASGRLLGPLQLGTLRWQSAAMQLELRNGQLDWSPGALLAGNLSIQQIAVDQIRFQVPPEAPASPPPSDLRLPVAVDIEKISISSLDYAGVFAAGDISARFKSDGRQHQLSAFRARAGSVSLGGTASLDGQAPLALSAQLEAAGQLAAHPLAFTLLASGTLTEIMLNAIAREGLEGQADLLLTPFAPAFFSHARIAFDNLDPAAWQAGAPAARLALRADVAPGAEGITGHFSLANAQAGPLDQDRLPIARLDGDLDWQGKRLQINSLQARLPGGGRLTGSGQWQDSLLSLTLAGQQLDAMKIWSSLRSTALNGPISAELGLQRQALTLDLKDARFSLRGAASHAADALELANVELAAGNARLSARGKLVLSGDQVFSGSGSLSRFDPSRFARLPAGLINARIEASGKLKPRPVINGQFKLQDSQFAGQPLSGKGQLNVDWPAIPQADITLTAGPNRITAQGAFGRPADRLTIAIRAPELAPYGIIGGLSGDLDLAGALSQPRLSARVQSDRIGLPGKAQISGLTLSADIADSANAPLKLDLALNQLDTPDQPALARQLQLHLAGSRAAHRLTGSVELPGQHRLKLLAEGGLASDKSFTAWRGQLLEMAMNAPDTRRSFLLSAPASLRLDASAWQLGPARFNGSAEAWQANLQAESDTQRLQARLDLKGPRVGVIEAELSAGMLGPWSINAQAPWQGKLLSRTPDLAWLGEQLGEGWQSGGQLDGELQLAGRPSLPLLNGRLRGQQLELKLPDQGLHLARGELAIDIENNLLRVRQFSFDSLLQALPKALRQRDRDELKTLTAQPGRLEIRGEMRVDRSSDSARLEVRMDRLGLLQSSDQWLTLSGTGQIDWRDGSIGARGKLAVDAAYWQLAPGGAPRLSEDVIIKRAGDPAASRDKLRPRLDLDISTDFGRNFLFNGAGLSTRLAGEVRLTASGRDLPRASGSIRAREGRFEAYGQQLEISRGVLTFQGLPDNPAIDVLAVRHGLAVEPGVQIGGTAQKPVVRLVSDPELPDAEKLAWLVLGHGSEQMGAGDATVLLSAAGGLLGNDAGNLLQQLKRNFGLDEFGVRQGDLGNSSSRRSGSRVAGSSIDTASTTGNQILSVGKRLSANALLSYEQSLGQAESIVKLTVNLSRRVSVIGRAGSDNALDVFYTFTFGER